MRRNSLFFLTLSPCDDPSLFTFSPFSSSCVRTVAYSVCDCFLAGNEVRLYKYVRTQCLRSTVLPCVLKHPVVQKISVNVFSHTPGDCLALLQKEQLSFVVLFRTSHYCSVCLPLCMSNKGKNSSRCIPPEPVHITEFMYVCVCIRCLFA